MTPHGWSRHWYVRKAKDGTLRHVRCRSHLVVTGMKGTTGAPRALCGCAESEQLKPTGVDYRAYYACSHCSRAFVKNEAIRLAARLLGIGGPK